MEYNEDFLKKVVNLGSLEYPLQKCMNVLELAEIDKAQFIKDFNDPNSIIYKNYQAGIDVADFEIDTKLFQLAKTGDLKSLKEYNDRKRQRKFK